MRRVFFAVRFPAGTVENIVGADRYKDDAAVARVARGRANRCSIDRKGLLRFVFAPIHVVKCRCIDEDVGTKIVESFDYRVSVGDIAFAMRRSGDLAIAPLRTNRRTEPAGSSY